MKILTKLHFFKGFTYVAPSVLEDMYKSSVKSRPRRQQTARETRTPSHIVDHNYVNNHPVAGPSRVDQLYRVDNNFMNNHVSAGPAARVNHFEPYNNHLDNHIRGGIPMNVNNHVIAGGPAARVINHFEPFRQLDNNLVMGGGAPHTMDTNTIRLDNYPMAGPARPPPQTFLGDPVRNANNDDLMFIDRRLSMMDVSNDLPPV